MMFKKLAISAALAASLLAPIAASAGEVYNRVENQQDRINQGVQSGQLTYGEYHRLDGRLDQINSQRRADLRANGGSLTPAERSQLNREQNNLSDRIYFDKHNRARQH